MAGLSHEELPVSGGLVDRMTAPQDFIVPPLPNLLFTRDSSVWLDHGVAVTALAMGARRRETTITAAIYTHHPRFAGTALLYGADPHRDAWLEGGDVLVLAPGVLAVGVGQRTSPAGAEAFAQRLFAAGAAHAVLAVPIAQDRATMHLDTVCTMVDRDAVVMYPPLADTMAAYVVEPGPGDALHVSGPEPFLSAAAAAMEIGTLRVIDTGLDPITAEREQWDDGNNTLALAPGVVVAYERNVGTNERLEQEGIEVLRIAGSELGTGRGGSALHVLSRAGGSRRERSRAPALPRLRPAGQRGAGRRPARLGVPQRGLPGVRPGAAGARAAAARRARAGPRRRPARLTAAREPAPGALSLRGPAAMDNPESCPAQDSSGAAGPACSWSARSSRRSTPGCARPATSAGRCATSPPRWPRWARRPPTC